MSPPRQTHRQFGRLRILSPEVIPAFLICAAVCFNLVLAFVNANLLGVGRGDVILGEIFIVGAALVVCLVLTVVVLLATLYRDTTSPAQRLWWLANHPTNYCVSLASRLENPQQPSGIEYPSLAAGGLIVLALTWLRMAFIWWPIHPLGFVMATSWASLHLWFSLFLGWLFKLLIIRSAGLRGFVRLRPLFMGLIMGDVLGAAFWIIVGLFTGTGIWFIPD